MATYSQIKRICLENIDKLNELYLSQPWPLEKLPYTVEFETITYQILDKDDLLTCCLFWRVLGWLRRMGYLKNHTDKRTSRTEAKEKEHKRDLSKKHGFIREE